MLPELGHAGMEEALDRIAGLLEPPPVDGKAWTFEREHEARWNSIRPFAKRRRRLRAIERAVDLDRSQPLTGIGQLLGVRQPLRIEHPTPRRVGPAADPDADFARFWSHFAVIELG